MLAITVEFNQRFKMTASDRLKALLSEQMDGQHRAVLVLGAGLHSQILQMVQATSAEKESAEGFCNWKGLLKTMAIQMGGTLTPHDNPTATWEELVLTRTKRQPQDGPAHQQETKLLSDLTNVLKSPLHPLFASVPPRTSAQAKLRTFFGLFRDVVTFNMDLTISTLLDAKHIPGNNGRRVAPSDVLRYAGNVWPRFQTEKTRIWHMHGHVHDQQGRDGMILGMRNYGMNISTLESARKDSKKREQAWKTSSPQSTVPFGIYARSQQASQLQLMDLFLHEPMVFVGCDLGWAETDLWWALNQRARNLARIPESKRQPVFVLMKDSPDSRKRLASRPAGVEPIFYQTFPDIWNAVGL